MPSYLIALAVGCLEQRELSARCAVWSEKEMVDRAAYEFADTDKMLSAAEELLGPYGRLLLRVGQHGVTLPRLRSLVASQDFFSSCLFLY